MNSRGNITFIFDDTYTKNLTTKYLLTKHNGELTLYCYVKKGEFYQDLMGNTFRIVKDIEKQYAAGLTLPENQDLLAWTQENSAEILNFKTVKMDSYPFKNTYRFLFNSQEDIKDKKIILTRNFDISLDELKEIYLLKGLNLDMTIQTNINGDTVNYPLNTYIDVIKTSYNIMNEQLLFDNPFEKVLAIYDAIRNTNIPIDKNFLFQEILYSLYIPNCPFLIKKDENELVRTVAYLNDPKYRIDGFYSFDVAFEDKRNFNYFAKTAKEITALNKIDEVSNESVLIDDDNVNQYFASPCKDDKVLLYLRKYLNLIPGNKEVICPGSNIDYRLTIKEYAKLFNRPILADQFVKALYKVKKINYMAQKDIFALDDLLAITMSSNVQLESTEIGNFKQVLSHNRETDTTDEYIKWFINYVRANHLNEDYQHLMLSKKPIDN